jgi:hypothetical protein
VGVKKRKEKKTETHPRGESLGLGFIPSKKIHSWTFFDGAVVGDVSQRPYSPPNSGDFPDNSNS